MTYAAGRVIHDADSHLMELGDCLDPYFEQRLLGRYHALPVYRAKINDDKLAPWARRIQADPAFRANVDMLGMMDAGDAPIFVHNFDIGFGDLLNLFLHHGLHAVAVKARADEVGLHNVAYIDDPEYDFQDPSGEGLPSFLLRHLQ